MCPAMAPRPARRVLEASTDCWAPSAATAIIAAQPSAATTAAGQEATAPSHTMPAAGTSTAVMAGPSVWAKNTSMRSTSRVARDSRSPVERACSAAGERGSRRRNSCTRRWARQAKAT